MIDFGLDPDDDSVDPTTPVGVGNLAAKTMIEARINDGSNQLGTMPKSIIFFINKVESEK